MFADAWYSWLGATVWQKQKDGELEPIEFTIRFLNNSNKLYESGDLN